MFPVGMGTARGLEDDGTDEAMVEVLLSALALGVNVIDTAVNYRGGRSERAVGQALRIALARGVVSREHVLVCSKGGYTRPSSGVPAGGRAPEPHGPFDHCLSPACLRYQLETSMQTLGLDYVDVYYVHNPEEQCGRGDVRFETVFARAFETLEDAVERGWIRAYGVATWSGAHQVPGQEWSIAGLKRLAGQVAGGADRFDYLQAPLSFARQDALAATHPLGGDLVSLPRLCQGLGLTFVASAAGGGGKPPELVPSSVRFACSVPGVTAALVSTLKTKHLDEILARIALAAYGD